MDILIKAGDIPIVSQSQEVRKAAGRIDNTETWSRPPHHCYRQSGTIKTKIYHFYEKKSAEMDRTRLHLGPPVVFFKLLAGFWQWAEEEANHFWRMFEYRGRDKILKTLSWTPRGLWEEPTCLCAPSRSACFAATASCPWCRSSSSTRRAAVRDQRRTSTNRRVEYDGSVKVPLLVRETQCCGGLEQMS